MLSKRKLSMLSLAIWFALLCNLLGISFVTYAATPARTGTSAQRVTVSAAKKTTKKPTISTSSRTASKGTSTVSKPKDVFQPFMHRPYYGNTPISQRTNSYFDHDHPWYDNDKVFVRYDGKKWTNTPIGSCTMSVNCYDGHNGYDINMRFEPVLSAAAGTVTRAGWYNPMNHYDGFGIWVAVDHGNGYLTAYGHLSAVNVAVGQKVGVQERIGVSGTTGASTGPHLHMSVFTLPYWNATDPFGWSGSTADPNPTPDHYLWVDQPGSGTTVPDLNANNGLIHPKAVAVDDGDPGYSSNGAWQKAQASNDVHGDMRWTTTTSGNATASATWRPTIPQDGYYEVGFYVDDNNASSTWLPITVYSADPAHNGVEIRHVVYLDESHIGVFKGPYGSVNTGPQWISLGTYYFRKTMNGRVMVSNNTGEQNLQIGVDCVEFVPLR